MMPPAIATGGLTLYQFYDVGYAIDLDQAQSRLTETIEFRKHARLPS